MLRLDRYILAKYIKTFLLALALIIIIVITFDLSEKLDDFLGHHAPLSKIIFEYYFNFIPGFVNLYSPLFIFIAVIFFTSKMAGNTEVIAILGAGISYRRMLRPYLYGSVIVALVVLLLGNFVIPYSNRTLNEFEENYVKHRKTSYYHNIHFQSEAGVQIYTENYDVPLKRASKFRREVYDNNGRLRQREVCDFITYDTVSGLWRCDGYSLRTIDKNGKENLTFQDRADVDLHITPADLDLRAQHIETMPTPALIHHIQRETLRGTGTVKQAKIELWQRILNPLAIIVMTFIGVAVASRKTRGGIGLHLAIGIAIAFAFILFMKVTTVFATNGDLSPFMSILLPQIIFGAAAWYLVYKAPK